MPRLNTFELLIKTGKNAGPERLRFNINGFPVDFDELDGSTASGETMTAKGQPNSFPHSLCLIGPDTGSWDIETVAITYDCDGSDPYTVKLGAVTLDEDTELNIWHEAPLRTFDV